jgi:MscS family membrane protein
MTAFLSSATSAATALLTPEFWALRWPLWRASILTCGAILLFRICYRFFILRLAAYLKHRYHYDFIDSFVKAFNHPIQTFLWILAFYSFIVLSPLNPFSQHPAFDKILRSSLIICLIWGVYNLCDAGHGLIMQLLKRSSLHIDETLAEMISALAHMICVMFGIVLVANEWDYDITAFVASLGIGAMAIAFAAKDSLANIFGSLVIITERPFVIGDWISANNVEGIVESITFRSTCIRTFYQELVYVPNNLLSNTPIINYTQRQKYRIQFMLGLTYSTTREQMQEVCQQIRSLCERLDEIYNDGIDVNFFEFGDSSLNIRIVCYAKAPNNSVYLRAREKFNLEVMKILEENGVSCAFPSRSVYFETPIPLAVPAQKNAGQQVVLADLRNAKGVRIEKTEEE